MHNFSGIPAYYPYNMNMESNLENRRKFIAQFHQDVKAGRPNIKTDAPGVFSGAMFHPDEAQDLGLINGMMTLDECIENAAIRAQYNH